MRVENPNLLGESQAAARRPVKLTACAQHIQAPQRRDDALAHSTAFAKTLGNLQILALRRAFDPEEHLVGSDETTHMPALG